MFHRLCRKNRRQSSESVAIAEKHNKSPLYRNLTSIGVSSCAVVSDGGPSPGSLLSDAGAGSSAGVAGCGESDDAGGSDLTGFLTRLICVFLYSSSSAAFCAAASRCAICCCHFAFATSPYTAMPTCAHCTHLQQIRARPCVQTVC